ncbi:class I SAM-dependent methyltransferase [Rhizobium sp. LEGMi198b]|uniref:class I SAM-dependent methyltransferase n=1 Tax=unclassified Rhizobium TaxID=2613769 RepID=UPI000CDF3D4B|nr:MULTISPECIES: class I SAM-dependent methyltransferase [Rhizobium]AVA22538.1 SAM-dependent methyltransferase protein [Rhizobium sp. NXC24]MDK4738450.1 class I SAM-dependent methyltransferase [Rhizobium sp. CNPSo 3464]UWU19926.1 class I SAM-dependent methyltransferase [Rhizobium tropici]WFU00749.1 class I SAM-dependent methyltransferase [Rhizobium sp. CB3171]
MSTEEQVASHYTRGSLEATILGGLTASGKDIEHLSIDDLAGVDEFHLGRREATVEFAKDLDLLDGMRLIDIGSGIGGSARYIASEYGCIVTGVDLTEEFVNVANALTARCGMTMQVSFHQASALALPFADESFERATLIHVGMNIEDKASLFAEIRRVLKRGGRFGLYEIMQVRDGAVPYPMPWAMTPETSFVCSPMTYRQLLKGAGFTVEFEQDRSALAIRMAQEMRASAANGGQGLSLGALMGPRAAERMGNVSTSVGGGLLAPIEMVAKAD